MEEKKVVLVEDDPDHADLILDVFETENVESDVVVMRDGMEAVDYFQEMYFSGQVVQSDIEGGNSRYPLVDLVILDLNLPKVDGISVLKFLKNDSRFSSIPVVILSTSSDQDTISKAYKNGANKYIVKPISYDEFVEMIESLRNYWINTNTLFEEN
ncbi:MAG: response regulator [Candidatus Brocadiales bacterium]|nr:response regulator [Candidatus Brocadiales bacterium]